MQLPVEIEQLSDPRYFIEKFFWIVDKDRNKVPFIFNPPQLKYYNSRTHFDLILKSRKEGFSSLIEAIWLYECLFTQNTRAVVLSHEMESTKRHFDRIRFFLDTLREGETKFNIALEEDTQKQIKFPHTNSSYFIGTAGAKAFGRGDDITHLHLSEVAHYQDQTVLTSTLEACVPNAYRVMETTAFGVGEAFHRLWKEAKDPQSGSPWKPHFFSWYEDPSNSMPIPIGGTTFRMTDLEEKMQRQYNLTREQVYWYRMKRSSMSDKALMAQEHPGNDQEAFLSSGRHAFTLSKIQEKKQRARPPLRVVEVYDDGKEVSIRDEDDGRLKIWRMPRQGDMFLISGDVGEGIAGGDYSVMQILDRTNWEQVAIWRGHVDPGEFGRLMVSVGYFFNNAVLVPENNNHGWATIEAIRNEKYPHLLKSTELWKDEAERPGFPTNERTRTQLITALRNANDDDTVFINDLITLEEMEVFTQNERTNKFEAQKGCHDDTVISLGIATYCLQFLTVTKTYGPHVKRKLGSPIMVSTFTSGEPKSIGSGHRRRTGY